MIIAILSSLVQYFQSKQLMPNTKDARKLRDILKSAGEGKQADNSEIQAATSRSMLIILPAVIFFVTVGLPSALGLYWLVGGIVAIIQQTIILREDEEEMEAMANESSDKKKRNLKDIPEAEVVTPAPAASKNKHKSSSKNAKKKRRKR
jgi:YidC/Oxa1 family membrane protein insertase